MKEFQTQKNLLQTKATDVCKDFFNHKISHQSTDNIINHQFASEGTKRVESFLFEFFLKERLKRVIKDDGIVLSFGWFLGFNKHGIPSYWFRFQEHKDDWNEADEYLVQIISESNEASLSSKPTIQRILFIENHNSYKTQSYANKNWSHPKDLVTALNSLPLKRRSGNLRNIKKYHFDDSRFKIASKWIKKRNFSKQIESLSIQRRLINCYIVPNLNSQIVDLDAIILTRDKKISCLEFKRKYPAKQNKTFGLDAHPHIGLIKHFAHYSIRIRHLILVPPDWNKYTSPLSMLDDEIGKGLWHWLAVDLSESCIGITKMNTYGEDSGQSGENRAQYNIVWDAVHIINYGIKITTEGRVRLLDFLATGDTTNLPKTSYSYLDKKRRKTTLPR